MNGKETYIACILYCCTLYRLRNADTQTQLLSNSWRESVASFYGLSAMQRLVLAQLTTLFKTQVLWSKEEV